MQVSRLSSSLGVLAGAVLLAYLLADIGYEHITSGDTVFIRADEGAHIDVDGDGSTVKARWQDQGDWQRFVILKKGGSRIRSDDLVSLKAWSGRYVDAHGSGVEAVAASFEDSRVQLTIEVEKPTAGDVFVGDVIFLKARDGNYVGTDPDELSVHVREQRARLVIEKKPPFSERLTSKIRKARDFINLVGRFIWWRFTKPSYKVDSMASYKERAQRTLNVFREMHGERITLAAEEHRHVWGATDVRAARLDLTSYVHILGADMQALTVDVEGRAYFADVLRYLIEEHNATLAVIPDMVHLTVGGLYSGIGGGAASFKFAGFHHSVVEVDVLTGGGELLTCSPAENADLFASLPGSLGTFGYALRLRVKIIPAKRYVVAQHRVVKDSDAMLSGLTETMASGSPDFLDAVMYGPNKGIIIEGVMMDTRPKNVEAYSLQATGVDYAVFVQDGGTYSFELLEYIYRWDAVGYFSTMETPEWTRHQGLRSTLAALLPSFHRSDWIRELGQILYEFDLKKEGSHMCVDFCIPIGGLARHLDWLEREVNLYPLYLAPINLTTSLLVDYSLWNAPFPAIDIGVGYGPMGDYGSNKNRVLKTRRKMEEHFGRVEGGTRLMYTNINLDDPESFWALFPAGAKGRYEIAKSKYDPKARFPTIVDKMNR